MSKVTLRSHSGAVCTYNGSRDGQTAVTAAGSNRIALGYVIHDDAGSGQDSGYPTLTTGGQMTTLASNANGPRVSAYYTLDPAVGSQTMVSHLNNGQSWAMYLAAFDNVVQQAPPNEYEWGGTPTDNIATDHGSDMVYSLVGRFRDGDHGEAAYTPASGVTEMVEGVSPGDTWGDVTEVRYAGGYDYGEPAPGGTTTVGWNQSSDHVMYTTHLKAIPQRNNAILLLSILPGLLVPAGFGKLLVPQLLGLWKDAF